MFLNFALTFKANFYMLLSFKFVCVILIVVRYEPIFWNTKSKTFDIDHFFSEGFMSMKTVRKLAAVLIIATLFVSGAFAYDQNFDGLIVDGEWIVSTSEDNFSSIAGNTQVWEDFMTETIGAEPDHFYNVNMSNLDDEDNYVLTNLQGYIEKNCYVEDNDVYAYIIARSIDTDTGIVPDGWLVLTHYSAKKDIWTSYMYYFGID